jgi:hypothetical protein
VCQVAIALAEDDRRVSRLVDVLKIACRLDLADYEEALGFMFAPQWCERLLAEY